MKHLILSIAILLVFAHTSAQTQKMDKKQDYIVLTRKIPQLNPILKTAESLKRQEGEAFGKFEVVICGKTVKDLKNHQSNVTGFLRQAKKLGVRINVCGFSMNKFDVKPDEIPKGLKVVANGILYDFERQKEGYLSIEL